MYHPWRHLRDLAHVRLEWRHDTHDLGCTHFRADLITMSTQQTQAERRCTIAHELVHLERGPVPPHLEAREEEVVEREAARRLIDLHDLGEALAWSPYPCEVADELWVDEAMLEARLAGLHPSERAWLRRRMAEVCK